MSRMRPGEVLDGQVDLIRWWRSDHGQRYGHGWVDAGAGISLEDPTTGEQVQTSERISVVNERGEQVTDPKKVGAIFALQSADELDRAETFAVADTMTEMILRASQAIPRDPLRAVDLPTPAGWVVLNRSVWDRDVHGKDIAWRAAAWAPTAARAGADRFEQFSDMPGVCLTFYTDTRDDATLRFDDVIRDIRAAGKPLPRWLPLHTVAWAFDQPWDSEAWVEGQQMHSSVEIARRVMHTFWAISQQYVTRIQRVGADRHLVKRIDRAGVLTGMAREIKVVTLRKVRDVQDRPPDHEPREVRWSHRWTVGGHWRNQWYPQAGTHRPIWIDEYEKGPEHLPLVEKDTVYQVTR